MIPCAAETFAHGCLEQNASVVLVSELDLPELPPEVEIQPISSLAEVAHWADYVAIDVPRENLPGLREMLGFEEQAKVPFEAQAACSHAYALWRDGDCGVCAVTVRRGWRMACKDGPVFDLKELL